MEYSAQKHTVLDKEQDTKLFKEFNKINLEELSHYFPAQSNLKQDHFLDQIKDENLYMGLRFYRAYKAE